jgi:outer membrane protein TolC
LPIRLDTVLRQAEEQNVQVRLARARVREACALQSSNHWLPGALFHKQATAQQECKVWQQKAEASRILSDKLLEAAGSYLDLLAARTAEGLLDQQVTELERLLADVERQAPLVPAGQIEVPQVQAELQEQRQALRKAREQAVAGAAQLSYLLDLDPHRPLAPGDAGLVPLDLVNVAAPLEELVSRALASGPGVYELEQLVALSQKGLAQSRCPGEAVRAQAEEADLAYQDLRGKLTACVIQAREAAGSARAQFVLAAQQIGSARRFSELSEQRRQNNVVPGHNEVLLSRRTLLLAQLNYVNAVRAYDKAQIQLLILLSVDSPAVPGCNDTALGQRHP